MVAIEQRQEGYAMRQSPSPGHRLHQSHHAFLMTLRKILITGLLVIGILAASVVLFFAGDHDDPDQGGGPTPTLDAHP
jgi:hypothetical protein